VESSTRGFIQRPESKFGGPSATAFFDSPEKCEMCPVPERPRRPLEVCGIYCRISTVRWLPTTETQ
jgi:hypothetical protein